MTAAKNTVAELSSKQLHELVKRVARRLIEESTERNDYIQRMLSVADGALGEFVNARYAELNLAKREKAGKGTTEGWDKEVRSLIAFNFHKAALCKAKWDIRAAFDSVIDQLRMRYDVTRRWSCAHVAGIFGVDAREMEHPDDDVLEEFVAMLENEFDAAMTACQKSTTTRRQRGRR